MPKVFLSYRHEDDAHCERVRGLALRLEAARLDVVVDQLANERRFRGGGPDEGWPMWSSAQAGDATQKLLIVASPGWFRCYEGTEVPGKGLGAAAEAAIVRQRLYNSRGINRDIRVVAFGAATPESLPLDLQRYHVFSDPVDFADLVRWLGGASDPDAPASVESWPELPPALSWAMANHDGARDAFAQLLTRGARKRLLPLRGPTETGKSLITKQMLGIALRMPGLACGRFDFKGTTDVDAELRAFVQHLDVRPPSGTRLVDRLGRVLEELQRRERPALLILDTYEAAGEVQDWVEKQLLPALIRAEWLRVVAAGQRVPRCAGTPWAEEAHAALDLSVPGPEDWFAFAHAHKPAVTLEFVTQAHQYCDGKPSVLAQLLGPKA